MSAFEFFFTFYGLVLGLVVTNVATGIADVWRAQGETRLGLCTPLLGLLVLLLAAQSWLRIWNGRDLMEVTPAHFLVALGAGLPLAFVSRAMFPRAPDAWRSLDDYYLRHAGVLLAVLVILPMLVRVSANAAMFQAVPPAGLAAYLLGIALVAAVLMRWRRRWLHVAGLMLLCGAALYTLALSGP